MNTTRHAIVGLMVWGLYTFPSHAQDTSDPWADDTPIVPSAYAESIANTAPTFHLPPDIRPVAVADLEIMDVTPVPDGGYLMVGYAHTPRTNGRMWYTPTIARMDAQGNQVWDLTLQRLPVPAPLKAVWIKDHAYILGTGQDAHHRQARFAHLLRISAEGEVVGKKQLAYPRYYAAEGVSLLATHEGTLVIINRIFEGPNAFGTPWALEINEAGTTLWQRILGADYIHAALEDMQETLEGNIIAVGSAYASATDWSMREPKPWVLVMDRHDRGETVHEQVLPYPNSDLRAIMPYRGQWFACGMQRTPRSLEGNEFLVSLKADGRQGIDHVQHTQGMAFGQDLWPRASGEGFDMIGIENDSEVVIRTYNAYLGEISYTPLGADSGESLGIRRLANGQTLYFSQHEVWIRT